MKKILICVICLFVFLSAAGCRKQAAKQPEPTEAVAESAPVLTETKPETQETKEEQENMIHSEPIATITMQDGGIIKLKLDYESAPNTVKNFIYLANSGFYDGVIFHRVISGFMIQGGDPEGTGTGGPGYRIKGEFSNNHVDNKISHKRGVISMARQGNPYMPAAAYNTAGSQFFIMHADGLFLDGDYAAFGEVIEGMDVVDRIAETQTNANDRPLTDQVIQSIRVDTFGKDYGEPERIAE